MTISWERCGRKGRACRLIGRLKKTAGDSGKTYKLSGADVGHRIRVLVSARNAWGHTTATSHDTRVITRAHGGSGTPGSGSPSGPNPGAPSPTTPPPTGSVDYFATVPSSGTGSAPAGIPRSDATCAAAVQPAAEVRPQNTTANNSVPSNPSTIPWSTGLNGWPHFVADRDLVTGNYKGTTDEILQWVSCKWGIDINLVRADAWTESNWIQSTVGDSCGTAGDASYGILQVKNANCSGQTVHGGYPYTQDDTALDADYWGARLRACFDGAFYDGGQWLYNGQSMAQVLAAHGQDYAMWGCVGSWYSGSWYDSGAQSYIAKVQSYETSKPWLSLG